MIAKFPLFVTALFLVALPWLPAAADDTAGSGIIDPDKAWQAELSFSRTAHCRGVLQDGYESSRAASKQVLVPHSDYGERGIGCNLIPPASYIDPACFPIDEKQRGRAIFAQAESCAL